jgi:Zn-finger nucleic acid-binding protein
VILSVMNFLSKILRYFISRQREYRADAISVRLTRNPLSLAEALKLISRNWHGAGASGERLESIFIVNPRFDHLDDEEGIIADLFSTHPPLCKRVEVLLGMAHLDEKTLDESLKNFQRVSPVAKAEFKTEDGAAEEKKWSVFKEGNWLGPFLLEDLKKIEGIRPDQWIKLEGQDKVIPAYEDSQLKAGLFGQSAETEDDVRCPHCKVTLTEINYEGVPVYKCSYCAGVFVEEHKVSRIFTREDLQFSSETTRLAQQIIDSKDKHRFKENDANPAWVISCPKCKKLMRRQFFVYSYPVEIDRCFFCSGIWFDKEELEILQYLYQHKEEFFDGKNF